MPDSRHVPADQAPIRVRWRQARAAIEDADVRRHPDGEAQGAHSEAFRAALRLFDLGLRLTGIRRLGVARALDVRLARLELAFSHLPAEFDGYRILHLTDLHLDAVEGLAATIRDSVAGCTADLCLVTGDFREQIRGPFDHLVAPLAGIVDAITAPDGIYATLGNHDEHLMVDAFEPLGMRFLTNQTMTLTRGNERLHVTGVDDPHRFFTPMALEALNTVGDGFRIAAVHSPELAEEAAAAGHALYLCGHTHGGQICLPGGRPILTKLFRNRTLAVGLWRRGAMTGYTSPGAGVCGTPVRYFSRPEVTLITLRRAAGNR